MANSKLLPFVRKPPRVIRGAEITAVFYDEVYPVSVSNTELIDRAFRFAAPVGTPDTLHIVKEEDAVRAVGDGGFRMPTLCGQRILAQYVSISRRTDMTELCPDCEVTRADG
jgi:hypothetical protein